MIYSTIFPASRIRDSTSVFFAELNFLPPLKALLRLAQTEFIKKQKAFQKLLPPKEKMCSKAPVEGTVAIVGLGYGGTTIANQLANSGFKIIGINETPYFTHAIAALRALANPAFENKVAIPLNNIFSGSKNSNHELVIAPVRAIAPDAASPSKMVIRLDGREIRPDYIVIATGSSYTFPAKFNAPTAVQVAQSFSQARDVLKRSSKVVIIGGGAVGVELAGEIASHFPGKKVTIVHSQQQLVNVPGLTEKFKQQATQKLSEAGVEVILGERIVDDGAIRSSPNGYLSGEQVLRTATGRSIPADLVFLCTGSRPNNGPFAESLRAALSPQGRLVVNDHLQVRGFERVFAIGDCADIEGMMGYFAGMQAAHTGTNIERHARGQSLKPYAKAKPAMFLPIGPEHGVGQLPMFGGMVVGDGMVAKIKGRELFVAKYWGDVKATLPK